MLASFLLLATASAPIQDLADLDRQIAAHTGAAIGEHGGAIQPVDRRLKLRGCAMPVAIEWRSEERSTLVLRCPDAGGWRLYMPVRTTHRADAQPGDAMIAVHRGDAVSIAVEGQGFSVSRPGEAMEQGAVGDWIKVRPVADTRRRAEIIRARIVKPGVVALPLG